EGGDGHLHLRPLVGFAAGLVRRAAHGEGATWDANHLERHVRARDGLGVAPRGLGGRRRSGFRCRRLRGQPDGGGHDEQRRRQQRTKGTGGHLHGRDKTITRVVGGSANQLVGGSAVGGLR